MSGGKQCPPHVPNMNLPSSFVFIYNETNFLIWLVNQLCSPTSHSVVLDTKFDCFLNILRNKTYFSSLKIPIL